MPRLFKLFYCIKQLDLTSYVIDYSTDVPKNEIYLLGRYCMYIGDIVFDSNYITSCFYDFVNESDRAVL